jgi:hypothetical protein
MHLASSRLSSDMLNLTISLILCSSIDGLFFNVEMSSTQPSKGSAKSKIVAERDYGC